MKYDEMLLNTLAYEIHANAKSHGFWDNERNMGEMLMLAVSELSEALESHRNNEPFVWWLDKDSGNKYVSGKYRTADETYIPLTEGVDTYGYEWRNKLKPEGVAVELVDCIIRCLDTLHSLDVDIDSIMLGKMIYNARREHKHGKAY